MRELSLHVMDIAQNSIAAQASMIVIDVLEDPADKKLIIRVGDNGQGMDPEMLEQARNPFFTTRTTRSIGMGIPLFQMACEMTGGSFSIDSAPGAGTSVEARFYTGHIDMTPIGDMEETILLLVTCNPELDFVYTRRLGANGFTLDTRQLREILGDEISLGSPEVVLWLKGYLQEGLQSLYEEDD